MSLMTILKFCEEVFALIGGIAGGIIAGACFIFMIYIAYFPITFSMTIIILLLLLIF